MNDLNNASRRPGVHPSAKKKRIVAPEWKPHLDSYKEKRILTFDSEKDLEAAIDLLWTAELRGLPHDTADGKTLIIPAEAVSYFTRARLRFTDKRLRSLRELRPLKEKS